MHNEEEEEEEEEELFEVTMWCNYIYVNLPLPK
jgi:hypothetical protein